MEIKMAISHYMSNTAFTGILKIPRKLITSKTHATSFFNVCGRKKEPHFLDLYSNNCKI